MLIFDQMTGLLEILINRSLSVIFEALVKVIKEIFKFIIILLIIYYFALWIFKFIDEILQSAPTPPNKIPNVLNTLDDLVAHQIVGETYLRIGPPDENLIKKRASLLEQLEIEAEFEENQKKLLKSEADLEKFIKKEIHTPSPQIRGSDDFTPVKDLFISQIKQELNETSRASQTIKTSLGKKSKLKNERETGFSEEENEFINKLKGIKKEILTDQDTPRSSAMGKTKEVKQEIQYFDDQYDHESFHRV